jgi:hypothetical protein
MVYAKASVSSSLTRATKGIGATTPVFNRTLTARKDEQYSQVAKW